VPNLTGVSHISLSVRDRDVSVRWYVDVLGFDVAAAMDEDRWKRSVCLDSSGIMLSLTEHQNPKPFDYANIGVDHVSFAVSDRSMLDEWQERFTELGVVHSPVVDSPYGSLLSFSDPDGIALELFHLGG
jgi:glyoxylase I family protein